MGELELVHTLRTGLESDEPLDLIATVSGLLEVTDPRQADPFRTDERPSLAELVDSFLATPAPETTAVLAIIRAMVPDEIMGARIGRELARRDHPLPAWLAGLTQVRIESEVWFLTDVLGDGDDYIFGVTLPSGHRLSALVYVDHNLGSVVKDAFVIPDSLPVLVEQVAGQIDESDQTLTRVDPAQARAIVEQAIEDGSTLQPPLESDSWPMCRPVIEWMLRMLPAGGTVPERTVWSEEELASLADDFFASPYGIGLDDHDRRDLLRSVFWFATESGPGDPLRWSGVAVELLLLDWVPRKIIADPAFLAQLPELLRAFIRYAHDRRGIGAGPTMDPLSAIDQLESEYLQRIQTTNLQGPAALFAQLIEASGGELPDQLLRRLAGPGLNGLITEEDLTDVMLENLAEQVGGQARLAALGTEPLPDEPFSWEGIPGDIRPVIEQVLTACDGCADALLDVEHRTAMRRFLSRAAIGDPAIFRRKASPVRGAAAVAWAICRANDTAGGWHSPLTAKELLAWFGVKGSMSQRAEPMLRAVGADPHARYGEVVLGTPDLLVSSRRAEIVERRERCLQ